MYARLLTHRLANRYVIAADSLYPSTTMRTITDVRQRDRLEAARERKRLRRYNRERLVRNAPLLATSGTVIAIAFWMALTR
ncbi:hypothetical protein Back2_13920 [Nocardioides baekrokdamisoli]|uniref:Uncharacterized protein n=2 Tax=Nocardioides baekrokdamisoli TaxID=1804624 RepID=A0A3G9IM68_9ACTN|nr:hypothetical protein Back2_13920 [Nocardioides baekrokdamisoli]